MAVRLRHTVFIEYRTGLACSWPPSYEERHGYPPVVLKFGLVVTYWEPGP